VKRTRDLVVDKRRAVAFFDELRERARAWIPGWEGGEDAPDVTRALLQIAARFGSEVTERLDRMQEKNARGLLDWLGIKPRGARPARMPVVFKMADAAPQAVLAVRPIKLQADAQPDPNADVGTPDAGTVVFETEADVLVSPARLDMVVAADPAADAFFLPAPGLTTLGEPEAKPSQWTLRSFAENGATQLQLDPELGLAPELVLSLKDKEYRVTAVDRSIVTIEPPLEAPDGLENGQASAVSRFAPFSPTARNRQLHVLYIGDENVLNIEAAASICVKGIGAVPAGTRWQYWGKVAPPDPVATDGSAGIDSARDTQAPDPRVDDPAWRELTVDPNPRLSAVEIRLLKKKGTLVPREIGGKQSRWIRASVATVSEVMQPIDELRLSINCDDPGKCPDCPDLKRKPSDGPVTEGFYNSNPLVVSQAFYPFGQEPRQFDSFYLGCDEAFSKKGAKVCLCFQMAGPQVGPMVAVRTATQTETLLFGVGADGSLHVLKFDSAKKFNDTSSGLVTEIHAPVQPPAPRDGGVVQTGPRIRLEAGAAAETARVRPTAWRDSLETYAVVWSGTDVWIWHEASVATASGWRPYGRVGTSDDPKKVVRALASYAVDAGGPGKTQTYVAAVRDGALFFAPGPTGSSSPEVAWQRFGPTEKKGEREEFILLETVCDVRLFTPHSGIGTSGELVVVDSNSGLHARAANGIWHKISLKQGAKALLIDRAVCPVAVRIANGDLIIAAKRAYADDLVVFRSNGALYTGRPGDDGVHSVSLEGPLRGNNLDFAIGDDGETSVIASVSNNGQTSVVTWIPALTQDDPEDNIFYTTVPPTAGTVADTPVFAANHLIVPRLPRDVLVASFTPSGQALHAVPDAQVRQGVIVRAGDGIKLTSKDSIVARLTGTQRLEVAIVNESLPSDSEVLYQLESRFSSRTDRSAAFKTSDPEAAFKGTIDDDRNLVLDDNDRRTKKKQWLLLEGVAHQVKDVHNQGEHRVAELDPKPGATISGKRSYWRTVRRPDSRHLPVTTLQLTPNGSRDWPARLSAGGPVVVPAARQKFQRAQTFKLNNANQPVVVALVDSAGEPVPPADVHGEVRYAVNGIADFVHQLSDATANPELSWEYWNGTGWWKLQQITDRTGNLKTTGTMEFTVPDDFAESDWAGRKNHWIRARLVGGDYGREVVGTIPGTVNGVNGNIVARSTDDIHAPYVLILQVSYSICNAVLPQFVLTDDSGTTTDQSAANRTPSAIVKAFIPLSESLRALDRAESVDSTAQPDTNDCSCGGSSNPRPGASIPSGLQALSPALYFGFTDKLEGGPLNLLLLANERDHDRFAPATIEVLRNGRFEAVTSQDDTRAAGENGVLTVQVPLPTTAATLFGQARHWMRLCPRGASTSQWKPELTGVFFNAVWATAAETQDLELLGSSDGGPNQRFLLARPPVMDNTLELRVLESLGEEERKQLASGDEYRKTSKKRVRNDITGHPGDWVRWDLVIDPLDEDASMRCYSLDESTGEVRFGDGAHGRIPPMGRDSIMAASYRRSESSAANRVEEWANLSLVTPIDGVESAFAPMHAAGGSDSEKPERVMVRGAARLRYRGRAVTLQDLEDIALDSSPEIAQAKALTGVTGVRLIVVMRGSQPLPRHETLRELRSQLLSVASPDLALRGRLSVEPSLLRPFGVTLSIDTADLSASGRIVKAARTNLFSFFDPATGGMSGTGWLLGSVPQKADIAASVLDIADLQAIREVSIFGLDALSRHTSLPSALRANELAWLPPEGIEVVIRLLEASV